MAEWVLGIHDGTHDAGAALVRDGEIVAACNEERFTGLKGQGGWPDRSIRACLERAGIEPREVGRIAVAGLFTPNPLLRGLRPLQRRVRLDDGWFWSESRTAAARALSWLQFDSPLPRLRSDSAWARLLGPPLREACARRLPRGLAGAGIALLDHHLCHAASAYYTFGRREALVVVADGVGDGLALTVHRGRAGRLEPLAAVPHPHSYGLLYGTVTGFLGFRPFRDEGKLTGLAALGRADAIPLPFPFDGPPEARTLTVPLGSPDAPWLEALRRHRREDVSAWLQRGLEEELSALIAHWIGRTGLSRVALAGGVFGNVRLNQRLAALPEVDELFVFPHMGDGGLAAGAALLAWAEGAREPFTPRPLRHAFLGPAWDAPALEAALGRAGLPFRRSQDVEGEVAALLASGRTVAHFDGAMEFGPRALGNRSILAPARDPRTATRLNVALSRSEFMPFAPAILAEEADAWLRDLGRVRRAAPFMTVTVAAGPEYAAACPATVHVDGTLRPQTVDAAENPRLHRILDAYRRLTGVPAVINTSFNLHGEPIVRTPEDAIRTFRTARLDALAIGPFLVSWAEGSA